MNEYSKQHLENQIMDEGMIIKSVTFDEIMVWKSALATCAIEGNEYAQEQLALYDINRAEFVHEYIRQRELSEQEINELSEE